MNAPCVGCGDILLDLAQWPAYWGETYCRQCWREMAAKRQIREDWPKTDHDESDTAAWVTEGHCPDRPDVTPRMFTDACMADLAEKADARRRLFDALNAPLSPSELAANPRGGKNRVPGEEAEARVRRTSLSAFGDGVSVHVPPEGTDVPKGWTWVPCCSCGNHVLCEISRSDKPCIMGSRCAGVHNPSAAWLKKNSDVYVRFQSATRRKTVTRRAKDTSSTGLFADD